VSLGHSAVGLPQVLESGEPLEMLSGMSARDLSRQTCSVQEKKRRKRGMDHDQNQTETPSVVKEVTNTPPPDRQTN
jgi:hypothetical protein